MTDTHRFYAAIRRVGRFLRHFVCLLPAAVALILYILLPHWPAFTEMVFSRWIFRFVSVPLGFLTSLLPISLTEIVAVLVIPAVIVLLTVVIIRLIRLPHRKRIAIRAGKLTGWVVSFALLLYMLLHGMNFYRQPLTTLMGLDTSSKTAEFLQAVCIDLAQKASAEREHLSQDSDGNMVLSQSLTKTLAVADEGYHTIDGRYPFLWGAVMRAKPVQVSHWWSYTGITGMYFPLFAEANVNIDQPDSAIPATAAHELAHTRGFAREDECNFIACLTCFNHPSADYRYSGYLLAYVYCSNALYSYDQDMWKAARAYCSEGVLGDLTQRATYWKAFEGKVQEAANKANNSFIQSQGVDDGVLSYNRMVELLLAYYEQQG